MGRVNRLPDDEVAIRVAHARDGAEAALSDPNATWLWWYCSFADGGRPAGSHFLGCVWIDVPTTGDELVDTATVIARCHMLEINPGGEVQMMGPITEEQLAPHVAPEFRRRLLTTRSELEAIGADVEALEALGGHPVDEQP